MSLEERDIRIAAVIGGILVLGALIVVIGEDVLKEDVVTPPAGHLSIREVDVRAEKVSGETVQLNVSVFLDHGGETVHDSYILLRAVNMDSGLKVDEASTAVPEISGERTARVFSRLVLPRTGRHEVSMMVFIDGSVRDRGSVVINGLGGLEPESHRTGVKVSDIVFVIKEVRGDRVIVEPRMYLDNYGSNESEDLRLQVRAREVDSNILAGDTLVQTSRIPPESTVIRNAELDIPAQQNYIVEVLLWKKDALSGRWSSALNLAPTKRLASTEKEISVPLNVSKFVRAPDAAATVPSGGVSEGARMVETSGFDSALAVLMVITAVVMYGRHRRKL
ncbi:MAG TPA: hypothetical protein HA257_02405 [Candidatus Methanoperedenaceae archaeon]|nr:hypothetical protein [Candidatus Methanoperedenaceae archaeon]